MPSRHLNRNIHRASPSGRVLLGAGPTFSGYLQVAIRCYSPYRTSARRLLANAFLTILGALLCVLSGPGTGAQAPAKKVLILYGFNDDSTFGPVSFLESSLRARVPGPIDFYVESFENGLVEDNEYQESVATGTLQHVYQNKKLDLVMVGGYQALQFALRHRDELFPGVPIVFFFVDIRRALAQNLWPGVTGVTSRYDLEATIDLAIRLHPASTRIALIVSRSKLDEYWLTVAHDILKQTHSNVQVVDFVGLPIDQLPRRIVELPSGTIVWFGIDPRESIHPAVGVWEVLEQVGQLRPTYCAVPPGGCLIHGGIGGAFFDVEEQNLLAAQTAARVLAGERPEDIPIAHGGPDRYYFSWPALERWHIPESALPPGSVILYRQPTLWERDRKYIIVALGVILAQALLIAGLLWQRARKRKAEAVLRESEERFRVMADTTPSLIWMCDPAGKVTYLNERWLAFTGHAPQTAYGDAWIAFVHPEDLNSILHDLWQALHDHRPFSKEYRLHRNDGAYRWMLGVASPRVNGDGSFAGFIGSAIDITDQKLAQEALESVSGQLIEAQEKERTRIARDLHDDICQRLAVLAMELEKAKSVSNGRVSMTRSLEEIRQHCSEIASDVQSLSHQLHSSRLDLLGIAAAIHAFCNEFSKQHGVKIELAESNVPEHLPQDISLCLFRVAQEALHNAVKYSGTRLFKVELTGGVGEVRLKVVDSGVGFDVGKIKKTRGLGLVSMQERVHLVHGEFSVVSKRGEGTTVLASVPIIAEKEDFVEDDTTRETASVTELK